VNLLSMTATSKSATDVEFVEHDYNILQLLFSKQ